MKEEFEAKGLRSITNIETIKINKQYEAYINNTQQSKHKQIKR